MPFHSLSCSPRLLYYTTHLYARCTFTTPPARYLQLPRTRCLATLDYLRPLPTCAARIRRTRFHTVVRVPPTVRPSHAYLPRPATCPYRLPDARLLPCSAFPTVFAILCRVCSCGSFVVHRHCPILRTRCACLPCRYLHLPAILPHLHYLVPPCGLRAATARTRLRSRSLVLTVTARYLYPQPAAMCRATFSSWFICACHPCPLQLHLVPFLVTYWLSPVGLVYCVWFMVLPVGCVRCVLQHLPDAVRVYTDFADHTPMTCLAYAHVYAALRAHTALLPVVPRGSRVPGSAV